MVGSPIFSDRESVGQAAIRVSIGQSTNGMQVSQACTITFILQVALFPQASLAVQVTSVIPSVYKPLASALLV